MELERTRLHDAPASGSTGPSLTVTVAATVTLIMGSQARRPYRADGQRPGRAAARMKLDRPRFNFQVF